MTTSENRHRKPGSQSRCGERLLGNVLSRRGGAAAHGPIKRGTSGDSPALAHELAELVVNGPKRATAGSAWVNEKIAASRAGAGRLQRGDRTRRHAARA